jgi:hypothetical protein
MRSQYQLTKGRRVYAAGVMSAVALFALVHGFSPSSDHAGTAGRAVGVRSEMALSAEAQLRAAERICRGTVSSAKCGLLATPEATL